MKKLSICIPTYNRSKYLGGLLVFLEKELDSIAEEISNQIEILVGDNCSTDSTKEICLTSDLCCKRKYSFFYKKNTKNVGIVNNLLSIVKRANGNYVWFMGDDDIYHEGILSKIMAVLLSDEYDYIFINHRAYVTSPDDGTGYSSAIGKSNYNDTTNKNDMLNIFDDTGTSLMFISSQIHSLKLIKDAIKVDTKIDIAYPLYLSFYSARNNRIKLMKEVLIDNVWGTISWKREANKMFLFYVPRILYLLPKLGYDYKRVRKILLSYIWYRKKDYFYYPLRVVKAYFSGRK